MPSLPDFKRRGREMLRPMLDKLIAGNATPIQLTYATLGLSAVAGALVAAAPGFLPGSFEWLLLLPAALAGRALIGALREMLEQTQATRTPQALLLRETGDALSDVLLYLPLALYPGVPSGLIVVFVVLGLCSEIAGLAAVQVGAGRRHQGPMAMNDRAIVFSIIALIPALDPTASGWLPWLLLPACAMALATIANRIRSALREADAPAGE